MGEADAPGGLTVVGRGPGGLGARGGVVVPRPEAREAVAEADDGPGLTQSVQEVGATPPAALTVVRSATPVHPTLP